MFVFAFTICGLRFAVFAFAFAVCGLLFAVCVVCGLRFAVSRFAVCDAISAGISAGRRPGTGPQTVVGCSGARLWTD